MINILFMYFINFKYNIWHFKSNKNMSIKLKSIISSVTKNKLT